MASIEVIIKTDDEVTLLVRRPYEVSKESHVFHGNKEKTSNFDEVFQEVIADVYKVMEK